MALQDKVDKLTSERDGIESTLTQQIVMYKKIIAEMESNYDIRMKELQSKYIK